VSELDKALREDKEWYAAFQAIPKGPKPCDAGCGKPATDWFGNTSCATCGSAKCVGVMQRDYDANRRELDEEGY
jgi:hypothetical protein